MLRNGGSSLGSRYPHVCEDAYVRHVAYGDLNVFLTNLQPIETVTGLVMLLCHGLLQQS